jgi:hypothetical protein
MKIEPITRNRMDELLKFLPLLSKPERDLEPTWHGIVVDPDKDGVSSMPYVTYPPIIDNFFHLAGQPCWSDYEYQPEIAAKMVENDDRIASASLREIKTMLTFCVRGERFCDGHWGTMVREGRIGAILRRLDQLRPLIESA